MGGDMVSWRGHQRGDIMEETSSHRGGSSKDGRREDDS